ncbi:hypothetical protein MKO06_07685 [Gramella sp. GC03-9]|uniref:Secreted protein n=1 Tax=Christiangramia oceanisediminis TaxID=2920386 RepID=A0A9X2I4M8_9FLAO|nr:hypothetical protein [Gramella oceanisediminis]MCP9199780.1 hypothetical protein [Gramella oceanisediminis]
MKTLIFSLVLVFAATFAQAQEITQLEEAKVGFAPLEADIFEDDDSFTYTVNEAYSGEFVDDPIAFMKANFDIQSFIEIYEDRGFDRYHITFQNGKGYLKAEFDDDGEVVKTYQKFTDIVLPLDVRRELYNSNKGWTMVSNKYIASGRGELIENETYKIKLENGKSKRNIKLDPRSVARTSVASNN